MVDLPRYVRAVRKPNGRILYYYEKYRGTPRAWPRIALPFDPSAPEFWARARQCEGLLAEKGEETWRFRWPGTEGRTYDLPDAIPVEPFWKALDAAIQAEENESSGGGKTFRALIAKYKAPAAPFEKLSKSGQKDYGRYLNIILQAWGDDLVADLTTVEVQEVLDEYADRPSSGRYFRAVLSRLVAYGIPRGFATANVVEHSEKPDEATDPYEPWPEWALEILFEHVRPSLLLPALSALYTGQRKVDVIAMTRPAADATEMPLIARKTGKLVPVQIHSGYRAAIDAAHPVQEGVVVALREAPVALHRHENGEPWTYGGFSTAWQRDMTWGIDPDKPNETLLRQAQREREANPGKVEVMAELRKARLVFHGFRKNAVNMLLECGSTEAEVSSIVEMSEQMVRHYAKDVDKRRLAINAMKKLESAWPGFKLPSLGT